MHTRTERDVVAGVGSGGVEGVRVVEDRRVTVGPAVQHEYRLTRSDRISVDVNVFGGDPRYELHGGAMARVFLDGIGPALRVRAQRGELLRMADERDDGLAQNMGRGDEPRTEQQCREHSELDLG